MADETRDGGYDDFIIDGPEETFVHMSPIHPEELAQLRMDFAMARRRIKALDRLLVCYRTGGSPSGALMTELSKTSLGMAAMGDG